ncbi:acireductone synthase [Methylocystis bryophila]|uniref:Enolase-phosphatase E1 n=1 Tax=Methylocystis bryophila TaxID=655015 RepID=A0A1W6N002_9HYPH|nr:acireductone synthase [Methylocystis bryophila]ARN83167.1 acireductone synthase [Methylocystis bryophila]BDV39501.1 enolase-phosphatase E1 [Methylocystis bryophila]
MSESIRAIVIDLEGAALPMSFLTQTLAPLAREKLGAFIAAHADEEEVEAALEETGRLMGGFDLKPAEAEALLLRWMKQDRKASPLKYLQGRVWREAHEAGALEIEFYADAAEAIRAWAAAGLRLFVYSSQSEEAQRMLLAHTPYGDLTPLFEGFLDTTFGQKIEPGSYRDLVERLALPAGAILLLSGNEEELDAARSEGLATARLMRDGAEKSGHPASPDFTSLQF